DLFAEPGVERTACQSDAETQICAAHNRRCSDEFHHVGCHSQSLLHAFQEISSLTFGFSRIHRWDSCQGVSLATRPPVPTRVRIAPSATGAATTASSPLGGHLPGLS